MISKKIDSIIRLIFITILFSSAVTVSVAQQTGISDQEIDKIIKKTMDEGDIPGLSLVLIRNGKTVIKSYGYSDLDVKKSVAPNTLFQLGSLSKSFTALAMLNLAKERNINLDTPVSSYLPWFKTVYKDSNVQITIRQLLNQTSGISWKTLSTIPQSNDSLSLIKTVRGISGIELEHLPGKEYEYATINYDIVALIIQTITGEAFEFYLQKKVINKLQLTQTTIGEPIDTGLMAKGYKIEFLYAREYTAPVFKGNNAAGYVISNANDMAKWLNFQIGNDTSDLYPLALKSHLRDETVAPVDMYSYGMGWRVSISGNGMIQHSGENPNFTTYMAFQPKNKFGIVILTNSNSNYTHFLGDKLMNSLMDESDKNIGEPSNNADKVFTLVSLVIGAYVLMACAFLVAIFIETGKGKRRFKGLTNKETWSFLSTIFLVLPFIFSLYLLPSVLGFSWQAVKIWSPASFVTMVGLIVTAVTITYFCYILSSFFPSKYNFKKEIPSIILASVISGISNMGMILLITSALKDSIETKYLIFYFTIMLLIYLVGRRYVQIRLIKIARVIIYDVRVKLTEKIFSTSYQKFEKIDKGRVYSTLNDDVNAVGNAANMIVALVNSGITAGGTFLYLATLEFWATLSTLILIIGISLLYTNISKKAQVYFEKARNAQNLFLSLLSGMIDGFKELSLRRNKKVEYSHDIFEVANESTEKGSTAQIKFLYASLIGELSLLVLLGAVAFGIPELFPNVEQFKIANFIILLLYLNGPLNIILNSVPGYMQLKVAWGRIQTFIDEIPANLASSKESVIPDREDVQRLKTAEVVYKYTDENGKENFSVGPIDLEIEKGQIIFIVGGNGSGKTTLAKLITGLYTPTEGKIFINDKEINGADLSEYFSVVFSPCHLFEKLYGINVNNKAEEIAQYMHLLGLSEKVTIESDRFSTINLSSGQRKRLALLQCYLDDSPIYVFDEWAADQDPEFRRFFYRKLLPEMRAKGKMVIAITHDDHYFDIADKILKMDFGKVEYLSNNYKIDGIFS